MPLGDGIENLLCSPDGTIWVGYIDEAIFKGANKDGRWPVSTGGIVQFDTMGTPLWSFNNQLCEDDLVSHSYAMTLSGTDLWACFHSEFPIVRIANGQSKFWPNSVSGATAMAVADGMVVLGGDRGVGVGCIAVIKLEDKNSRQLGTLCYTPSHPNRAGLLQGRGNMLHLVSNGHWYSVVVDKVVQALDESHHS